MTYKINEYPSGNKMKSQNRYEDFPSTNPYWIDIYL